MTKIVGPKKAALAVAEGELSQAMEILNAKRAELKKVIDELDGLKAKLQKCADDAADLEGQVQTCELKLDRYLHSFQYPSTQNR